MNSLIPVTNELRQTVGLLSDGGAILAVPGPSDKLYIPNGDFSDIRDLSAVAELLENNMAPLFDPPEPIVSSSVVLPNGAMLTPPRSRQRDSRTGAHLRAVLSAAKQTEGRGGPGHARTNLLGGWELANASPLLVSIADQAAKSFGSWSYRSKQDFANSASYMGSKRALIPFLLQPLSDWLSDSAVVVDLMCGSGCVAGAAATRWTTVASDAQSFCTALAGIQSGGYNHSRAEAVLEELQEPIAANSAWLSDRVGELLKVEEDLFHSALDFVSSARQYSDFVSRLPVFPRGGQYGKWDPVAEVTKRRVMPPFSEPSCLFTAYYADLYLGLRQAVEIDSIRHAIATLKDQTDRRWALGALLVATSRIATSYGGHFAQPVAPPSRLSDPKIFARVAMQRSMSIALEFEKRLLTLARESEFIANTVTLVPGPWEQALDSVASLFSSRKIAVYLDAPYRRDEYSRYYHVLETLVQYNYPSASPWSRMPDKGGERFASEFFTRTHTVMAQRVAKVIDSVLSRGWQCAWSYGADADASVWDVLEALTRPPSRLRGIAADHVYSLQGTHERPRLGPRLARELLLMIDP